MIRTLLATLLIATALSAAACGDGGTPTGSPVASDCTPVYTVASVRRISVIADVADRTQEKTAGNIETDLAAAHLSLIDGPASLGADLTTLDTLIDQAELALTAENPKAGLTLARMRPTTPATPTPFSFRIPAGSYGLISAPLVEFELIIDGCPNAAGQIGKATIRINALPWSVVGIVRRCSQGPIAVEQLDRRFPGFTNATTTKELNALHAARCTS